MIELLYFGPVKDIIGVSGEAVDLECATVQGIKDWVRQKYPDCSEILASCAISVNLEYVEADEPIAAGSEVAIIPPVSAG